MLKLFLNSVFFSFLLFGGYIKLNAQCNGLPQDDAFLYRMKVHGYDFDQYADAYSKAFYYDRWERDHEDEFDYRKMLAEIKPILAKRVNSVDFNKEYCTDRTAYFGEYTFDQKPYPNSFRFKISDTTDFYRNYNLGDFNVVFTNGYEFNHFKMSEERAAKLVDSRKSSYDNDVNRHIYLRVFYKIQNSKDCVYSYYSNTDYRLCAQITKVMVYSHEGGELFATLYPKNSTAHAEKTNNNSSAGSALTETERKQIANLNSKFKELDIEYQNKQIELSNKLEVSLDTSGQALPFGALEVNWVKTLSDSTLQAVKAWELSEIEAPDNSFYASGRKLLGQLDSCNNQYAAAFNKGAWLSYYHRLTHINRFAVLLDSAYSETDQLYAFCSNELLFEPSQITFLELKDGTVYGKKLNGNKAPITRSTLLPAINTLYDETQQKLELEYLDYQKAISNSLSFQELKLKCRNYHALIFGLIDFNKQLNSGGWNKTYSIATRYRAIISNYKRKVSDLSEKANAELDSASFQGFIQSLTQQLQASIDSIEAFNNTNLEGSTCSIQGLSNYPKARNLHIDLLLLQTDITKVHTNEMSPDEVMNLFDGRLIFFQNSQGGSICPGFGRLRERSIGSHYTYDLALIAKDLSKEFSEYEKDLEAHFASQKALLEKRYQHILEQLDQFKETEKLWDTIDRQNRRIEKLTTDFETAYMPEGSKKAINPKVYSIGQEVITYLEEQEPQASVPEALIKHQEKEIQVLESLIFLLDDDYKEQEKAVKKSKNDLETVIEILLGM